MKAGYERGREHRLPPFLFRLSGGDGFQAVAMGAKLALTEEKGEDGAEEAHGS